MLIKVKGVILKEMPYKESSKILTIYTEEYGKIGIIAKGSKKIKSPLRSVTMPFTLGNFHIYYHPDGLSTLANVDIINNYSNIKQDLVKQTYLSLMFELVDKISRDEIDHKSLFILLEQSLSKIENGLDYEVIMMIFELKVLNLLGVNPNLDSCSICGSKDNIITFSALSGGYLCCNCLKNNEIIVSNKSLVILRQLYYCDIEKIENISLNQITKQEIMTFIDEYYDKYTGIILKSKDFIKQIRTML